MIQTRLAVEPRLVVARLLGEDVVVGAVRREQVHQQLLGGSVAGVLELLALEPLGADLQQPLAGEVGRQTAKRWSSAMASARSRQSRRSASHGATIRPRRTIEHQGWYDVSGRPPYGCRLVFSSGGRATGSMKSAALVRHISVAVVCARARARAAAQAARRAPTVTAAAGPVREPVDERVRQPGHARRADPDPRPAPAKSRSAGTDAPTAADRQHGASRQPRPHHAAPRAPSRSSRPSPSPSGLPGLSTGTEARQAPVSQPLPTQASADGTLVHGYPASVLPPARGSTIETSSVSPTGRRLQVALNARTGQGAGGVLLFYRQTLTALGFTEDNVSATAGNQAAGFRRGQSSSPYTVTRKARDRVVVHALLDAVRRLSRRPCTSA